MSLLKQVYMHPRKKKYFRFLKKKALVLFSKWFLNDSCEAVSLNPAFPWTLAAVIGQYANVLLRDVQP